jgi:hypothetical protein
MTCAGSACNWERQVCWFTDSTLGMTNVKNVASEHVHPARDTHARGLRLIPATLVFVESGNWVIYGGKPGSAGPEVIRPRCSLKLNYVCRLESLRAPDDFELDGRTFLKATITVSLDRRKVDENILATLPLDETIPFAGIEPLYGSLLTIVTHVYFCSLIDSWRRQFCTSLPGLRNTNSRNLPSQPLSTTRKGYKSDKRSPIVP